MSEPTAELPLHIDATMTSCFRGCPQKFYKEFVLGLRPPGLSIDLHAGGCFASAIEETYKGLYADGLNLKDALERAYARFCVEWGNFEIPIYKKTAKTMDRTWEAVTNPSGDSDNRGYFDVYPPQTDEIKPYMKEDGKPTLEYTFAIPLEPIVTFDPIRTNMEDRDEIFRTHFPEHPSGGPFIYSGRFDMLGWHTGLHVPIPRDEKTSGATAGLDWAKKWQLRGQFLGYVWALQRCGIPATSLCVRGISILKTKIGHSETTQPYSNELVARWYEQLRRDLWRLRRAWDEGYWDFNFAETCTQYGNCIFMDSCAASNPMMWLNEMEVRRWNPLDKNPAKVEDPSKASALG